MNRIIVAGPGDPTFNRSTMLDMYRFRHKVFHDRLGWEVASSFGMEIDVFDAMNPVYVVAKNEESRVEGCWRMLPTTGPYMLKDTFPQLLRGENAPEETRIWELSRFAVESTETGDLAQGNLSLVSIEMIRAIVDFAQRWAISHFVTVTSVAVERLMTRAGIPLRRFGDSRAERVGKVLSVACWVDVESLRLAVYGDLAREAA